MIEIAPHGPQKEAPSVNCPVCEYPLAQPKYRLDDRFFQTAPGEFVLHHCASCELLFQLQTPELMAALDSFYPAEYWWKEVGRLGSFERRYRDWVLRRDQLGWVQSAAVASSGCRRLLDIGCGSGAFVRLALQAGLDAYGLERASEAARLSEQNAPGRIFEMSEQDLAARGEQFDILTLFHLLEHVPDPFRYLKRLRKLLRPQGLMFVQVPNSNSLQARVFGSRWYGLDCPRHLHNFSLFSVLHLLGRAGFRILQVQHFSLRDNAPALVSSLVPSLDPMSSRVRRRKSRGSPSSLGLLGSTTYLAMVMLAQPLAWLEAKLRRGATVKILASLDQ